MPTSNSIYKGKGVRIESDKYESWYGWRKDKKSERSKSWRKRQSQSAYKYHKKIRKQKVIDHDI